MAVTINNDFSGMWPRVVWQVKTGLGETYCGVYQGKRMEAVL